MQSEMSSAKCWSFQLVSSTFLLIAHPPDSTNHSPLSKHLRAYHNIRPRDHASGIFLRLFNASKIFQFCLVLVFPKWLSFVSCEHTNGAGNNKHCSYAIRVQPKSRKIMFVVKHVLLLCEFVRLSRRKKCTSASARVQFSSAKSNELRQ